MDCPCSNFYTAGLERVFYATDLDCFVVLEQDGDTLFLQSVVCKKKTAMKKILKRIIMKKKPGNLRETSKRKQSFRTRRGIFFIGKEHSADPALHSSRRKKYGLNTKTERKPWKNPRAVFCISVAFFPFFLAFQKDAVIIRESE